MPISLDNVLGIHEQALRLREQRAALLAANLANADTPHYKARDIDFTQALAVAGANAHSGPVVLRATDNRHLVTGTSVGMAELMYRVPTQPRLDGNSVDVQREHTAFMENAIRYQASLGFVTGRIKSLMTAIRGE